MTSTCKSCGKPDTYDPKRYPGGSFCENKGCPAYQNIPKKCLFCMEQTDGENEVPLCAKHRKDAVLICKR